MKKLAQDHPELGLNPDELISKLGKQPVAPTQTDKQATPKPTWPGGQELSHKQPPASKSTPEDEEEWLNTVHGGAGGGK